MDIKERTNKKAISWYAFFYGGKTSKNKQIFKEHKDRKKERINGSNRRFIPKFKKEN